MWEMKQTSGKSISIKRSDWLNVRANAISSGRIPLMHLALGKLNLVVMSEDDFDTLFPGGTDDHTG